MLSRICRPLLGLLPLAALAFLLPGDHPAGAQAKPLPLAEKAMASRTTLPLLLSADLVRKGLNLLSILPLLEVNTRLRGSVSLAGLLEIEGEVELGKTESRLREIDRRQTEIDEKLKTEGNEILRQHLKIMRELLETEKERNKLMAEQLQTTKRILDVQVRTFEMQKEMHESVLRKLKYTVPANTLVIVVADFSSGNADEGRELADEIAHHLEAMKKHGLNIHVLTGEIKPGVVIRSEEMARDIGQHFPPDTDYAVIWGSMSPRTVGQYRPHVTCVQKVGKDRGASATFTLNLESAELPLQAEKETYRRECYERLIAVTSAAVPSLYAAHQLARDRNPDLSNFYTFLGEDKPETRKFKEDLEPLTRWIKAKTARKDAVLRRLGEVSTRHPYPQALVNDTDGSVMVLITDDKGQAKRFPSKTPGKEEIVYIDVLEVSASQYIRFLEQNRGIGKEGGVFWVKKDDFNDIQWMSEDGKGPFTLQWKDRRNPAVINVNWFGARAYCRWAGKALPTEEEWRLAAAPVGKGPFPWGEGGDTLVGVCLSGQDSDCCSYTGGVCPKDRSRIGCFDMAGNVAEWCEDWAAKGEDSKRVVCGGSFNDKDAKSFEVGSRRGVDQVTHERWIGFRGVIRLPVDKAEK